MRKTFLNKINRWARNKPQSLYEWQFSPRYWNVRAKWEWFKFVIGKQLFGLRSWDKSQRQSFFILTEIVKTLLDQVILATVIVAFLWIVNHFLSPHITASGFPPNLDPGAARDFFGIVAQVAGVFLGLYFTAVSVVASTVYAKVPGEIRGLLTKEKVGNLYIHVVALTVAVASILLVKGTLGYTVSVLDVLFTLLLIVMAIFSFVQLGMRVFYFFDFTKLAIQLDDELVRWIRAATIKGFRFQDSSFQAHYQKQAEKALRTYSGVVTLAIEDQHFDGKALSELILRPIMLLQIYVKNKTSIPSESQWFKRIYRHRNWLIANSDEVSMALRSGTPLQPELVPDLLWFEKHIEKMIDSVIVALVKRHDLEHTAVVLDYIQRIQLMLGEYLAIDEALHLFKDVGNQVKSVMSVEDLSPDSEDTQLARLGLIEAYCLELISIVLGLSKTLRETQPELSVNRMDTIDWHKIKSIYINSIPREVVRQLEYLQSRLDFEYKVEGKIISPPWYCKQIAAQGMVRFIARATEELVKQYEEIFASETDRLILSQKYVNATQIIQSGLEACDKFIHQLETINTSFEQYSMFRRVQDIPWPTIPYEDCKLRIVKTRERVISNFAKSSVQLAKMPSKQNWPDYFGQCYSVLAEECSSLMAQGNEALFNQIFPAFFNATLAAHDRLRSELTGRSDQTAVVYMTEPIEDLLQISGYALVYSELDGKKYWVTVKDLWDRYLNRQQAKEIIEFINQTVNYRESILGILPRAILRTGWQQKLERRLRDEKILIDVSDFRLTGQRLAKNKHISKIIKIIARGTMGTIFSDGQDIFMAMYIAKRPEATGLELSHSAQNFLDAHAHLEDMTESESDKEDKE
jgi:hypothetical protein